MERPQWETFPLRAVDTMRKVIKDVEKTDILYLKTQAREELVVNKRYISNAIIISLMCV